MKQRYENYDFIIIIIIIIHYRQWIATLRFNLNIYSYILLHYTILINYTYVYIKLFRKHYNNFINPYRFAGVSTNPFDIKKKKHT